jgi:hypothetical protein
VFSANGSGDGFISKGFMDDNDTLGGGFFVGGSCVMSGDDWLDTPVGSPLDKALCVPPKVVFIGVINENGSLVGVVEREFMRRG